MAKDGTNRGGRRVRAGDKPDALADKITQGKTAKRIECQSDFSPQTIPREKFFKEEAQKKRSKEPSCSLKKAE